MIGHEVAVVDARPTVGGRQVGDIVSACHERSIDQGLLELALAGLDRSSLEPILTYCAERRCVAAQAACTGCRRATELQGIETLDAFVAAHSEITARDTGLTLKGRGTSALTVPSLAFLAQHWRGEERWFEARRVIRKLRHGIRTRPDHRGDLTQRMPTPAVILVEPQLPDNIGMVARAMANFGLDHLRLVNPRDAWPNERARIAASGATFIVEEAVAYPTLKAAMGDLHWVAATTARQRDLVKPVMTPEQAVREILERSRAGQKCGLLFGRERNGLESSEIADADVIVMAPVDPDFASLNLAQAVLLIAYEWIKATELGTLGRVTTYEAPVAPGISPRMGLPATREELDGFLVQLETELDNAGFLKVAHKRPAMVQNLRTLFTRVEPTQQEVRTLRGIVKALVHGKEPKPPLP